jgi:hypothetical protein
VRWSIPTLAGFWAGGRLVGNHACNTIALFTPRA